MKAENERALPVQEDQRRSVFRMDAEMIRVMAERIVQTFRPVRVILFGSRARGTGHEGSDVDLLVVLDECGDKRQAAIGILRLLSDFVAATDVVVTTPEEIARRGRMPGSVLRSALEEGKVLYERC